ncbi:bifunctional molybdenum cofactor biosynthesis protein MoaC/MoaB [Fodinibius salsisoli]|uniref:Bifunctional molybdenum cofactor biosynthesis protein MoaC/MoaB n=1 Tax=Fodinibius salsisoli TaxID=2820877 RepID=A0ABT3PTJ4_9BACT|nr:bifunctional molybdenum cofactor biosynthesis protein MoaC/MoaB [Fodinibius salsisoli]MCW9709154.1 bifunctional molybdenum cofactor biosynthesis protein MoaC/MoaB [Fodinibius salsisoli]
MRDISGKSTSLRTAKAMALVQCSEQALEKVKTDNLPKGNMLDVGRASGFLGAKNTHMLIPHCHPVSIDALDISYELIEPEHSIEEVEGLNVDYGIAIIAEGKSIDRTGIEMEILTAVSVTALTIYDLLKPLGDEVEISNTKLLNKTGGKSNMRAMVGRENKSAVLICSDSVAAGRKDDRAGPIIQHLLEEQGGSIVDFKVLPDTPEAVQAQLKEWAGRNIPFIFTVGGTGLGATDTVCEAVQEVIERETPGVIDAMELHGLQRTPLAMMSRLTAGIYKKSLIVTLPGSSDGLRQSLEGILPGVFYAKKMLRAARVKS